MMPRPGFYYPASGLRYASFEPLPYLRDIRKSKEHICIRMQFSAVVGNWNIRCGNLRQCPVLSGWTCLGLW